MDPDCAVEVRRTASKRSAISSARIGGGAHRELAAAWETERRPKAARSIGASLIARPVTDFEASLGRDPTKGQASKSIKLFSDPLAQWEKGEPEFQGSGISTQGSPISSFFLLRGARISIPLAQWRKAAEFFFGRNQIRRPPAALGSSGDRSPARLYTDVFPPCRDAAPPISVRSLPAQYPPKEREDPPGGNEDGFVS